MLRRGVIRLRSFGQDVALPLRLYDAMAETIFTNHGCKCTALLVSQGNELFERLAGLIDRDFPIELALLVREIEGFIHRG